MELKRRPKTNYIVIHCAYTTKTQDIGVHEIDRWHRDRGWWGIGYHFVIRRDGSIETGRPMEVIGAHVKGYNDESIGICLVGGRAGGKEARDQDNFTFQQGVALHELLQVICQEYPNAKVVGHRDLDSSKTCPVVDLKLIKRYNGETKEYYDPRSGSDDSNV